MVKIIADAGKNFITDCGLVMQFRDPEKRVARALNRAKILVHLAKESGADVVKFQCHVSEDERNYRARSRWSWIQYNEELTPYEEFWKPLKQYCDETEIEFMCTPMSKMAAEKINDLVKVWKVGSADITNFELLEYLNKTEKRAIISVGMSTEKEIDEAIKILRKNIWIINYCVSIYPCPVYKIDLARMLKLSWRHNLPVGLSDHSLSIETPALAVRAGAISVEKHLTMSRHSLGPDHKVSLLPEEFKKMSDLCRLAETDGESFEEEKLLWEKFRKGQSL